MKSLSSHQILVRPIVTEKNTMLNEVGKYCFEVAPHSNKIEIKSAVEEIVQGPRHDGQRAEGARQDAAHRAAPRA